MKSRSYFCFLTVFLTSLVLTGFSFAQSFKVEFSPTKVNVTLEKGKTFTQKFRVGNFSDTKKTFYITSQDFKVSGDYGFPEFLEKSVDVVNKYSLSTWLTLPKDPIEIDVGGFKDFEVTISVPQEAESGGHYAGVFIQSEKPNASAQSTDIDTVARVASLVLVTVPGDVQENLNLVNLSPSKKIYFSEYPLIELFSSIKNTGTVHEIPTGYFFLSGGKFFAQKAIPFNFTQSSVLPESPVRKLTDSFKLEKLGLIPPMGKIEVSLVSKYGALDKNYQLQGSTHFWLIPIKFLCVCLFGLLLSAFVTWRVILSFKKSPEEEV